MTELQGAGEPRANRTTAIDEGLNHRGTEGTEGDKGD